MPKNEGLLPRLLAGDERALSEILTRVHNNRQDCWDILDKIYAWLKQDSQTPNKKVIGITGPPGAGKSSLLKHLLQHFSADPVGVILVDPTSPFTGGAFLGDRFRLDQQMSPQHFIRSLGTRGAQGGVVPVARDLIRIFFASGKRTVFIETVGVGQNEWDIKSLADVVLLVVTPNSGDTIQTLKAGVMEVADLFVVNKADLPGAEQTAMDLRGLEDGRDVLLTSATNNQGIAEVVKKIHTHLLKKQAPDGAAQGQLIARETVENLMMICQKEFARFVAQNPTWQPAVDEVLCGALTPYTLSEKVWREL